MKRAAYALGAVVFLAALVVLFAPALVDTPAVRAEIQRRLAQALDGQITWDAFEIGLFPPHGELRQVRVEMPGRMSAAADAVQVYLRLWPLLRGQVEIASLVVSRPEVRIAAPSGGEKPVQEEFDAVAAYRRALEPVVRALQQLAPETVLSIEQAAVDAGELRDLNVSARTGAEGMQLKLSVTSAFWQRLRLDARVAYSDLSTRGRVELDALVLDKDLPPATVRAQVSADASAIEFDFEASLGAVARSKGKVLLPAGKPPHLVGDVDAVDLAQVLAIVRRKVSGLDAIEGAEGRLSARVDLSLGRPWRAHIHVVRSDAAVKLAQLPWKLSAHAGQVTVSDEQVQVKGLRGVVGETTFADAAAHIDLGKAPRLSAASGRATVKLEQWFPWLQGKLPLEEFSSIAGNVDVTLNRLALRFDNPAAADFEAVVTPRKVSAVLKALPAAVTAEGGSIRAGPREATLQNVAVTMLDAGARVSGRVGIGKPALELALSEGVAGEKLVQWALERGNVPARLEPKTPLRFAAQRIAWAPQGTLQAEARVDFEGGAQVALTLASRPGLLELPRIAIKDAASDAVLGATVHGDIVRASFAGTLHGSSIAAMLRRPGPETASGSAQGKLRVTLDRAQPRRTLAEGRLRIDALDLSWLAGRRVLVERIDLTAEPENARLVEAKVVWQEQVIELRGEVKRTARGPVIDARLESPGIVLEKLLPETPAGQSGEKSNLWPLPLTGSVEVRSGFVQYQERRIAPFEGRLSLERERARLEVQQARMCGVSLPLELEARPKQIAVAAHISMRDEPFEAAMRCLTGGTVDITGNADVRAELRSEGRPADLLRNLTGTVQAEVRNGSVKRFALIGNILSLRNIASVSEVKEGGFPYRSMKAKGHFEAGQFVLEEGFFDSNAVRLGAHGKVDLQGADSRLTVLVGLLTNVDRVTGAIPLVGYVFGGSMTALPVSVTGDIRDPVVVPLGPRAITDSLLGIFERTLRLPGKLAVPAAEDKAGQ